MAVRGIKFATLRFKVTTMVALLFCIPTASFAGNLDCSDDGFSILFVNGILTSRSDADTETERLYGKLGMSFEGEPLNLYLGYNASHLSGGGDFAQSLFQAFNHSVSTFDLNTILMQVYPVVHTRKILIVGHSQGAFYANELYQYLVTHGVSPESISVYAIATPASSVSGAGGYVTSANDKVINLIRTAEINGNVELHADSYYAVGPIISSALRPNITIPKEIGWNADGYGGHHFSIYMDGAGDRIAKDIKRQLSLLKPGSATSSDCFIPPQKTLAYTMQAAVSGAADPIASFFSNAMGAIDGALSGATASAYEAIASTRGAYAETLFSSNQGSSPQTEASIAEAVQSVQQPSQKPPTPKASPVSVEQAAAADSSAKPISTTVIDASNVPKSEVPANLPGSSFVQNAFALTSTPGFGGGGTNMSSASNAASASQSLSAGSFSIDFPADRAILATSTVTFRGIADPLAEIDAIVGSDMASTTGDGSGHWDLTLTLPEGDSAIDFSEFSSGTRSPTTTRLLTIDTIPPATTTVTVAECSSSIVSGLCVVPSASAALSWSTVPDAVSYAVAAGGILGATTTATAISGTLADLATTTFEVVAFDRAGNAATSTTTAVYRDSRPIVINEIAWGGDRNSATNQWIELKNISPFDLDLSTLRIVRASGDTTLSGTIPASQPYLVVEPFSIPSTNPNVVIAYAPLNASGEKLALNWGDAVIDATPDVSVCAGWCAGSALEKIGTNVSGVNDLYSPLSMERISDSADGTVGASWRSTDSYGPWIGAGGNASLWGTPGGPNSNGWPEAGVYCSGGDGLITQDGSFDPGANGCVYLTRFITGDSFGVNRNVGLYEGTVGSSTAVSGHFIGKALANISSDAVPNGTPSGQRFFFAIWESRSFANDVSAFNDYFTIGASTTAPLTTPHGNFISIPFTYAP